MLRDFLIGLSYVAVLILGYFLCYYSLRKGTNKKAREVFVDNRPKFKVPDKRNVFEGAEKIAVKRPNKIDKSGLGIKE